MQGKIFRLIASTLVFATPGELLFGSILIYYFRVLERQMGIAKFASFVVLSFVISTLLQIGALVAFPATVEKFASGPYGFIFSSMTLVYLRIPRLHNLTICNIPITDKFFAYLLALQMAFSASPSSLLAAAIGVITGCIYHFDHIGLQRIVAPTWVQDACARVLIPKHQSTSISQAPLQTLQGGSGSQPNAPARTEALIGPGAAMGGMGGFGTLAGFAQQRGPNAGAGLGGAVQANPDMVQSLVSVTGMPRHQVEQALVATNNNPDAATAQLLRLD